MQRELLRFARTAAFVMALLAFFASSISMAAPTSWADPIPVTDNWITLSKARNVGDFTLFRRYGFLLNDESQLMPNLFILNCSHSASGHYSYLAVVLPKHYPINSFRREDWIPHLKARFVVDDIVSLEMEGEYRNGEIDFDNTPNQAGTFSKVISARNLAIGFGDKNDVLKFSISNRVTAAFSDLIQKENYQATMGQITWYTPEQIRAACPSFFPPVGASEASEARVALVNDGGTFVVPVFINDAISLNFTVDSGAADVAVPFDVFSTLVRAGTIKESDITGSQAYVTATGDKATFPTFTIRSLKIGNVTVHNISGSVVPAQGGLLLGQSFLRRFKSWSIDNSTHELVLQ